MPARVQPITIRPGDLQMDARSNPDELDLSAWRYIKNFGLTTKGRLCRIPGWDKLLTKSDYNNQDLHDQLLGLTGFSDRLPIIFLFEAISTRKSRKLLAGTQNALYALNPTTGNWKIISDKLGSSGTRWRAAQLSDVTILTNNFDEPVYWLFDSGTIAGDQSVDKVGDFSKFGLTRVGTIVSWQGHIFAMNVIVDGQQHSNAIYWCNYQKPLDWIPNAASTAGSFDLSYGETILAALPLANRLMVYTNKGIWEGTATGTDAVFSFTKRYDPVESEGCLFYPNTLVSIGDEHVFLGIDGVYSYSLYRAKPERIEWMHKSSNLIFDNLNRAACEAHISAYNAERKELLFSYCKGSETLPSETLVFSTIYQQAGDYSRGHSYVLDHGFSAMLVYTQKSVPALIRDFLKQYCICDDTGLNTYWSQFTKEGGFCVAEAPTAACAITPASIWSGSGKTIHFQTGAPDDETITTEDYDQVTADTDSLCAVLGAETLQDLCAADFHQDECNTGLRFVVASAQDKALKEFSQNFYRETAVGFAACGNWQKVGYKSLLRSGPISAGQNDIDKEIGGLVVEYNAGQQTTPSSFTLRVGVHVQAIDPNIDDCGIIWHDQDLNRIECLSEVSAATHKAENTIPALPSHWPIYYVGRYVFLELGIENPDVTPADTGGSACISRATLSMRVLETNWF